ncbi:uncharacterized protein BXZ73DRAFT_81617 [Epithele typhae]|uniref:uncharacterized protein n=1 Tax=Epithele typhae TaxID=378194 RepID=UPI002007782C|nr:uncharacterized protein BXZ73DRAFT_81617 [Epithele typhae]KAH9914651.1 hypothetical protein BXZ73DRAFT_81617 [Epithele typhae]
MHRRPRPVAPQSNRCRTHSRRRGAASNTKAVYEHAAHSIGTSIPQSDTSHPRAARGAAKEADIDIRSVTVWFQNKRQTDRRIHRQNSEPALPSSSPPPPSLPPSSPFSDAPGNTITPSVAPARSRAPSPTTTPSAASVSATPGRGRRAAAEAQPPAPRAAPIPRQHRRPRGTPRPRPSLALRLPQHTVSPVHPPQETAPSLGSHAPSSSPAGPKTPEKLRRAGVRALWENMPSSPPEADERREGGSVPFGRRITLEYACAREMLGGEGLGRVRVRRDRPRGHRRRREKEKNKEGARREKQAVQTTVVEAREDEEDDERAVPGAESDGDTDTEGLTEPPVTPSSNFGMGDLSMDELDLELEKDGESPIITPKELRQLGPVEVMENSDLMDVAYVLCGLKQRC